MTSHYGEFAALLTTIFWTITALSFETASKRIGSMHLNLLRLGLATVLLTIFSYIHRGMFLPLDANMHNITWLALSGIVGFIIGDFALFKSFIITGARVGMLMMTLAPLFAALAAWIVLGEVMSLKSLAAMFITIGGIAMVIFTRTKAKSGLLKPTGSYSLSYPVKGILYGVVAAAGQGVGLVLSKYGMGNYDSFSSSQIRVFFGFIGFAFLFLILRKYKELPASLRDKQAMKWLVVGSIFGPFLGVSFSLIAVQNTSAGIAQTIMSLVPVLIIPAAVILNKEKVSAREIIGAVVAVAGVALFFL